MKTWIRVFLLAFGMVWCVGAMAAILISPSQSGISETTVLTTENDRRSDGNIIVLDQGEYTEISVTEYLTGVLLCEIPADFHPEAKKAQAIVARTYAFRVAELGIKHGAGVVCGDACRHGRGCRTARPDGL